MAKGQVPGGKARGKGSAGAKGTTGGKGRGGGGKGGGKGGKKKNKPCSCSKKPGKSNRDKANSTKDGGEAKCQRCGMTGAECGDLKLLELASLKKAGKTVKPSSIKYWRTKGSKIVADHKYPAAKIKKLPGFATLEKRKNLDAARKVMTAQFNMQKLCAVCNRKKSAGGNFKPEKLQAMIDGFLKK